MATEAEIRAAIEAWVIELKDYTQALVLEVFGINSGEVVLAAGANIINFADYEYVSVDDWDFIRSTAFASSDGADIGFEITDRSATGFEVTVEEACTFIWKTGYKSLNVSISD